MFFGGRPTSDDHDCYSDPVKLFTRPLGRSAALPLALALASLSLGCGHGRKKGEPAYVSSPQAILRDRVAAMYNKVGTIKNAERVEIIDRDKRFAMVRTASGMQGWVEQRYLVTQKIYDGFQKLAQDQKDAIVQATAVTHSETNLHLDPGRDTDHLYQLSQGSKLAVLKRAASEKRLPGVKPSSAGTQDSNKPREDWGLVRDPDGHVGWALGRMIDVDIPLEIAQYAEGQRIIASFVLSEVQDADKKVPQYLVLMNENKDGQPTDYNQLRVYTWNVRRHRYETAYREHIDGDLPVTVTHEDFDKEGNLPVFILHVKDDSGAAIERKYKLNTPIVRRVLAPGEQPTKNHH
jgi:SH3-like domain-containing protein